MRLSYSVELDFEQMSDIVIEALKTDYALLSTERLYPDLAEDERQEKAGLLASIRTLLEYYMKPAQYEIWLRDAFEER